MKIIERNIKYLPLIGYLGFFLMQVIIGILFISGLLANNPSELIDPPLYQPLTYLDLLFLLIMNIPTFILVAIAIKKIRNS